MKLSLQGRQRMARATAKATLDEEGATYSAALNHGSCGYARPFSMTLRPKCPTLALPIPLTSQSLLGALLRKSATAVTLECQPFRKNARSK